MTGKIQNAELLDYLKNLLGDEHLSYLKAPAEQPAVRINTLKTDADSFDKFLDEHGQSYRHLEFSDSGYVLADDNIPLSHTLKFFLGHFQYQSASSQLPVILLNVKPGERVLDMAAAPGSKSAQLAACLKNQGELVLNDAMRSRHQPLNVNMQRSGAINYYVLNAWGERMGAIFPEYFDKILLDAPCSALGTLDGNPDVWGWWSRDRMLKLSRVQYQLLVSAVKALKTGGELVYSTCSIAPEENELVIQRLLREYPVRVIDPSPQLRRMFRPDRSDGNSFRFDPDLSGALRIWPHRHRMEGFFVIKLRKTAPVKISKEKRPGNFKITGTVDDPSVVAVLADLQMNWGINPGIWQDRRFVLTSTRLWLVNDTIREIPRSRFVFAGLLLAEKRLFGWKLVNSSSQVLSDSITKRRLELNRSLLKELFAQGSITVPAVPNGYYALEFEGRVLACVFVENGRMRINLPHSFKLVF